MNKIRNTLNERPFGTHVFKALKLMRDGVLLGGLLTNSESWLNVTKLDKDELGKPKAHL